MVVVMMVEMAVVNSAMIYDSVLENDLYQAVLRYMENARWKRGWKSNEKLKYTHFNLDVYDGGRNNRADISSMLGQPIGEAWRTISKKTDLESYKVLRCYANLYEYAIEGYPHTDVTGDFSHDKTLILYCCDKWEIGWMGETSLIEGGEIIKAVLPKPNRLFMFPSKTLHVARGVTRECQRPRITLMFKVTPSA
jgi:SM-20-related protein